MALSAARRRARCILNAPKGASKSAAGCPRSARPSVRADHPASQTLQPGTFILSSTRCGPGRPTPRAEADLSPAPPAGCPAPWPAQRRRTPSCALRCWRRPLGPRATRVVPACPCAAAARGPSRASVALRRRQPMQLQQVTSTVCSSQNTHGSSTSSFHGQRGSASSSGARRTSSDSCRGDFVGCNARRTGMPSGANARQTGRRLARGASLPTPTSGARCVIDLLLCGGHAFCRRPWQPDRPATRAPS